MRGTIGVDACGLYEKIGIDVWGGTHEGQVFVEQHNGIGFQGWAAAAVGVAVAAGGAL